MMDSVIELRSRRTKTSLGITTIYSHLKSQSLLRAGQSIERGQVLGHIEATSGSTGPHLHFELRDDVHVIDFESIDALLSHKGFIFPTDNEFIEKCHVPIASPYEKTNVASPGELHTIDIKGFDWDERIELTLLDNTEQVIGSQATYGHDTMTMDPDVDSLLSRLCLTAQKWGNIVGVSPTATTSSVHTSVTSLESNPNILRHGNCLPLDATINIPFGRVNFGQYIQGVVSTDDGTQGKDCDPPSVSSILTPIVAETYSSGSIGFLAIPRFDQNSTWTKFSNTSVDMPSPMDDAPRITSLSLSPTAIVLGENISFTVMDVNDPNSILFVEFYRDEDFSGTINGEIDTLLGYDYSIKRGWYSSLTNFPNVSTPSNACCFTNTRDVFMTTGTFAVDVPLDGTWDNGEYHLCVRDNEISDSGGNYVEYRDNFTSYSKGLNYSLAVMMQGYLLFASPSQVRRMLSALSLLS